MKALLYINNIAFSYRKGCVVYDIPDTVVYQFQNAYLQVVNRYKTSKAGEYRERQPGWKQQSLEREPRHLRGFFE